MQFLQAVENAIREGVIYWHAFPFNGQLETMDEPLIRSSIHMTHKLDKDFGYLPKITLSQVGTSLLASQFALHWLSIPCMYLYYTGLQCTCMLALHEFFD